MAGSGLNFVQDLGDASYNEKTPESAWCSYIRSYLGSTLPFELVSGNHESDGMQGLIDNFTACLPDRLGNLTGTYGKEYYYDYPASNPLARIIMISPGLTFTKGGTYDYSVGSPHYKWTASAIDGARAAGIPWVIVGMHKVCLSTGSSTCWDGIGNDINNLLISKKVDLVLQGHDHSYQRSKQLVLNGNTCTAVVDETYNSSCVVNDGSTGSYTKGAGTVINIVGTGGFEMTQYGPIYTWDGDNKYFATYMGGNLNPRFGWVKVTVSASQLTAQFMGATNRSNFTDQYTITAAGTTPTSMPHALPTVVEAAAACAALLLVYLLIRRWKPRRRTQHAASLHSPLH